MGHKAVATTHNISNAFGLGTAKKCTVQWWFKKFCKGDESLEDEEHSGQLSEVDYDKLSAIIEAGLLTTSREVAEELSVDYFVVFWHLKQIGKMKKLNKLECDGMTLAHCILCHPAAPRLWQPLGSSHAPTSAS
ncbi:Histone-lysine N-methyltransferase SETMAR [Plecturocebus cupreus]